MLSTQSETGAGAVRARSLVTRERDRKRHTGVVAAGAIAALAFTGVAVSPVFAAEEPAETVSINVVTINDFHGRIEADGASAGAAVLAGAVQEVRDSNPNTVFAAAGDLIGATTFTSFIQQDNPTIDALNAAGLEVSAAGNHEFDQGWADLRDRVVNRADWEYLSSNVFLTDTGETALESHWVKELDGVRVGFIGAVTEDLDSLVPPAGMDGIEVRSIVDSVNAAAAELTDGDDANGEADVIVLLVHEGAETTALSSITPDSPLGEIAYGVNDDIDAIVSAHTHLVYNHEVEGRLVVSAGQYGENFGLMSLEVDPESKELVSIEYENKPLTDGKGGPLYAAVPSVAELVDEATEQSAELGKQPVGKVTGDFNRARKADGTSEHRGGESTIGNFVADVQMATTGAEMAFINPGGIRTDIRFAGSPMGEGDGVVTYREAAEVQPFANTMNTLSLTGAQIKSILEEQWQPGGASRPFLKLGVSKGLTYTYDPEAAQGEHITSITFNGAPLDPAAEYTVAANSFLASGGDNFVTFAKGTNVADTGVVDMTSMVDWFKEFETATPGYAQRAVGVQVSEPASEQFVPGETVTVQLSSLAFTTNEPAPGDVAVELDGKTLATAPVSVEWPADEKDPEHAYDELGKATVSFALPSDAAGVETLAFTVGETGTTFAVELTVAETTGGGTDGGTDGGTGGGTDGGTDGGTSGEFVAVDGGAGNHADSGRDALPNTGGELPLGWIAAAAVTLAVGLALVLTRRRSAVGIAPGADDR